MWILRMWLIALVTILVFSPGRLCVSADQDNKDELPKVEGAIVTSFVEMGYPHVARLAQIQGPVVVRITLDDAGKVVSAEAIMGNIFLVRAALENVREWRFRPNRTKTALVFYDFKLAQGKCGDSRSQLFVFRPGMATITSCPLPPQPSSK
jgi:TonB family protein